MSGLTIILPNLRAIYNHYDCPWCGSPTRDYWVQIDWGWGAYEHPDDCSNDCGWYASLSQMEQVKDPDFVETPGEDLPF